MTPEDLFITINAIWWGWHTEKGLRVNEAPGSEKKKVIAQVEEERRSAILAKLEQHRDILPDVSSLLAEEIAMDERGMQRLKKVLADKRRVLTIITRYESGEYGRPDQASS
jgi:hypothetical protein